MAKNIYDSVVNNDSIILHISNNIFYTLEIIISKKKSFLDIAKTLEKIIIQKVNPNILTFIICLSNVEIKASSKKIETYNINNFLLFDIGGGPYDFDFENNKIKYEEFTEINGMFVRDITTKYDKDNKKKEELEKEQLPYIQNNDKSGEPGHITNPQTKLDKFKFKYKYK